MRRLESFGAKISIYSHDIALQATAYNDTVQPYLKFGVYRGSWKGTPAAPLRSTQSAIAYGALKVGNERMQRVLKLCPLGSVFTRHILFKAYCTLKVGNELSSYDEVSTAQ